MTGPEIIVTSDVASISHDVADRLVQIAKESIAARGRFTFCLSGGSTPKSLFELMATDAYRGRFDWSHIHVFWGDERSVPPDHADSNYRMASEALLSKVPIPAANVHRMEAEAADLPASAAAYEAMLRQFFAGELPNFDVLLLGMGPDGHTASLFPGSQALSERQKWVVPNWVEKFNTWRMTLTYPVLDHAERIFFLAGGKDKADVLKTVLEDTTITYPCQGVKPDHGDLIWFIDTAAAARLTMARA